MHTQHKNSYKQQKVKLIEKKLQRKQIQKLLLYTTNYEQISTPTIIAIFIDNEYEY